MAIESYVIRGGLEGRERLRVLARVMWPTTESLFARVGIAGDARCLDLGCGGGDVSAALATLVPDGDGQLTSDHGFDFARDLDGLRAQVAALKALGCRVSLFADAGADIAAAAATGADRIELYTGPYAEAFAAGKADRALPAFARTAALAGQHGLGVNAGHDLSQANLAAFVAGVPDVLEVSIGHALIGEALYDGLDATVRRYLAILERRG